MLVWHEIEVCAHVWIVVVIDSRLETLRLSSLFLSRCFDGRYMTDEALEIIAHIGQAV